MKKEVPTWAIVASALVVLVLVGWFMWNRTAASVGETVVPKEYGDQTNPYGNRAPAPAAPGGSSGKF